MQRGVDAGGCYPRSPLLTRHMRLGACERALSLALPAGRASRPPDPLQWRLTARSMHWRMPPVCSNVDHRLLLISAHKHAAERSALEEMLAKLPNRAEYLALWDEYARGCSREARLVKSIDRIEMLAQALAYERAGSRALGEFWEDIDDGWGDEFPVLRELAAEIMERRTASLSLPFFQGQERAER